MQIDLAWSDLSSDPGKYVEQLQRREGEIRRNLYQVRQLRRLAEKVLAQQNELTLWTTEGIPDPPSPSSRGASTERDDGPDAGRGPRKMVVARLMAQDRQRSWKVRDLADALGIENVKSLRVSLDDAVRDGTLEKTPDASYVLGPRADDYLD